VTSVAGVPALRWHRYAQARVRLSGHVCGEGWAESKHTRPLWPVVGEFSVDHILNFSFFVL
jgi:hypothetical protein